MAFEVFIERILVPSQILTLDNLNVHKSHRVEQMIEAASLVPSHKSPHPKLVPESRLPVMRINWDTL